MAHDDRKVHTVVRLYVPATRVDEALAKLREWSDEEREKLVVRRTGESELTVSQGADARTLSNGTLSGAAWLLTTIERAYSDLFEYRWFGDVSVRSGLHDPKDDAGPKDGEKRVIDDVSYVFWSGAWVVDGEMRTDPVSEEPFVLVNSAPTSDGKVEICDVDNRRRRFVERLTWESWAIIEREPKKPTPFSKVGTDEVRAEEDAYEREHPKRAEEF